MARRHAAPASAGPSPPRSWPSRSDGIGREAILNAAVDNAPARRLYERLGFRVRGRYWEGMAAR